MKSIPSHRGGKIKEFLVKIFHYWSPLVTMELKPSLHSVATGALCPAGKFNIPSRETLGSKSHFPENLQALSPWNSHNINNSSLTLMENWWSEERDPSQINLRDFPGVSLPPPHSVLDSNLDFTHQFINQVVFSCVFLLPKSPEVTLWILTDPF